jgi:hypothetical protein
MCICILDEEEVVVGRRGGGGRGRIGGGKEGDVEMLVLVLGSVLVSVMDQEERMTVMSEWIRTVAMLSGMLRL